MCVFDGTSAHVMHGVMSVTFIP